MGIIGIALNGAAIFSALDALGRDAPAYEVQDVCGGHPERSGMYHIHDWSPCLPDTGVIGWMIDGHPILGPRFPDGRWVRNGDLDECHGAISDYELEGQQRRVSTAVEKPAKWRRKSLPVLVGFPCSVGGRFLVPA